MEIKNAFNILFAKFSINYRVLIYLFIVIAVVLAISVSIIIPSFSEVFESPETGELFTSFREGFGSFISGTSSFSELTQAFKDFVSGINALWTDSGAPVIFWLTFALMCIMIRFVSSICYPTVVDIINNFMSSNMSYGFLSNLLKNFKTGLKYSFLHTLISSVADILIIFTVAGLIRVFLPLVNLFALAIGLIAAVLLISVRLTFSAGVLPEMIVGCESNYFKAIKKSWPYIKKYFKHIFGAYCITVFCAYSIVAVLFLPTFGTIFFVLLAMFVTFCHILQLVFYYGSKNLRYYTDPNTIVNTAPIQDRLDLQDELISHDDAHDR